MNKLRQSFRRKKDIYVPEASRPHQWQTDEEGVRTGKCSFPVKYLGHVEVEESRGMHICEEAVKKLKMLIGRNCGDALTYSQHTDRKSFKGFFTTTQKKTVKAVLWVSADGLRVVDEKTKDLILDQTIEKVSFCAPDRNFERAFSYICRDGTTRRWICHCFMAMKDSGERLSHAVGCAFAACLEKKQKREKECSVTATFDANRTTFTREGSFRVTTATEQAQREEVMRQNQDRKRNEAEVKTSATISAPTSGILCAPPPGLATNPSSSVAAAVVPESNPHAIPRRHAPAETLARQGSFRGFPTLSQKTSPFKRQLSLRVNELPSTVRRKSDFPLRNRVPVAEVEGEEDSISSLCTQITTAFSIPPEDPFSSAPMPKPASPLSPVAPVNGSLPALAPLIADNVPNVLPPQTAHNNNAWPKPPAASVLQGGDWVSPMPSAPPVPAVTPSHKRSPSEAERWLEEVSKCVRSGQPAPVLPRIPARQPVCPVSNGGTVPRPSQAHTLTQADAFEAQWAALESKSRQRSTPSPTNPFCSDLHKTFEIQL